MFGLKKQNRGHKTPYMGGKRQMFEYEVVEELLEEYGCEHACEHCPYAEQCSAQELYWGCVVWEEQMGDDL